MRSDIRESFESLKKKHEDGALREVDRLYFRQLLNAYCDAWCFASDKLRNSARVLEEEAKEYCLLRDLIDQMKEGINGFNSITKD